MNMKQEKVILNTGETVELSSLYGEKGAVIFCFPKAFTSKCELEVAFYQNKLEEIKATGFNLIGMSQDEPKTQDEFCTNKGLTYPLICDTDWTLAKEFNLKEIYIEDMDITISERSTFVLDNNGNILKEFREVHETEHIAEVIEFISK